MVGKGIFHTNLVVRDLAKSLKFYTGLFGMEDTGFKDGDYVFLTTPGRNDLLTLNPRHGIPAGFPGGCAIEDARERKENLPVPLFSQGWCHLAPTKASRSLIEDVRIADAIRRVLCKRARKNMAKTRE